MCDGVLQDAYAHNLCLHCSITSVWLVFPMMGLLDGVRLFDLNRHLRPFLWGSFDAIGGIQSCMPNLEHTIYVPPR
jgi:hypothetical protein